MSDLIRRSEAVKRLIQETVDSNNNLIHINTVKRLLKDVDTAYDIDKVVKELEEWTFNADINVGDGTIMNHDLIVSKNAIEIVKQGGVSDDVCEWHKVKNGNAYKCNTHAEIHDSRVLDWCKCPYCGKKIKVVE